MWCFASKTLLSQYKASLPGRLVARGIMQFNEGWPTTGPIYKPVGPIGEKVEGKLDEKWRRQFMQVIRWREERRTKRRTLEEEKRRKEEGELYEPRGL